MSLLHRYESGEYLANAPDWHARDSEWKAGKVHVMVAKHAPEARSICDVGCGAGEVLAQLQRRMSKDTQLTGYDIAPEAIAFAKPKENDALRFSCGDLFGDGDTYDIVLALDVFEHVPDYIGFLTALSKRGRGFVFHIPLDINAATVLQRSKYMMGMRKTFGHLHYFTAETALATLKDCGYRVVDTVYTWDREMGLFSKPPRGVTARLKHWGDSAILLAQRFTNTWLQPYWARVRPQYNLLVFARAEPGGM